MIPTVYLTQMQQLVSVPETFFKPKNIHQIDLIPSHADILISIIANSLKSNGPLGLE